MISCEVKMMKKLFCILLIVCLLCACARKAPEPAPTPMPDPGALARKQRLSEAKDGFVWDDGSLRAIDAESHLRTDCWIGILHFGKDGRYTSGSRELDELAAKIVLDNTNASMTRMESDRFGRMAPLGQCS